MGSMPYVLAIADFQPEDDLDKLFRRLPQIEPPHEAITQILSRIKRLPRPASLPPLNLQDALAGQSEDTLIVRNEMRDPS